MLLCGRESYFQSFKYITCLQQNIALTLVLLVPENIPGLSGAYPWKQQPVAVFRGTALRCCTDLAFPSSNLSVLWGALSIQQGRSPLYVSNLLVPSRVPQRYLLVPGRALPVRGRCCGVRDLGRACVGLSCVRNVFKKPQCTLGAPCFVFFIVFFSPLY